MKRHDFVVTSVPLVLGQNASPAFWNVEIRAPDLNTPYIGRRGVFVCRAAGNFADVNSIAGFEYAVAVLGPHSPSRVTSR